MAWYTLCRMTRLPQPPEGETLDQVTGDWWLFQLRRGHRFSTDDVVTGWTAGIKRPDARRLIDLGAGVGSVGLMTLHFMDPEARSIFVEAQAVSHRLCRKTIELNGLGHRVELRHGDLRSPETIPETALFDLVTGSPPYMPADKGVVSPHPQRAACRVELRGSVFDYCRTATRLMKPDGTFVMVHSATDPRPERAIAEAGLVLNERRDIVFRAGRPATIAVFTSSFAGDRIDADPLVLREYDGTWAPDRSMLRRSMGFTD